MPMPAFTVADVCVGNNQRELYGTAGKVASLQQNPLTGSDAGGRSLPSAKRHQRAITATLSRSARSVRAAIVPLAVGPALIVILLLSLG